MILRGWHEIANFIKVHIRTAQRWHYSRLPMPLMKSAPGKGGKVSIQTDNLLKYLHFFHSHGFVEHKHSPKK